MDAGLLGILAALAEPVLDPASRTFWPSLIAAALVAGGVHLVRGRADLRSALRDLPAAVVPARLWRHRSTVLDLQVLLVRQLLTVLGLVPRLGSAWLLATWLVRTLDAWVGPPPSPGLPGWAITALYTGALFVAWDLSRYVLHRLMHEVPALWQLHQVHHSAEVLTPLTFHRLHPLESALYALRGVVVTGLLAGLFFWVFRADAALSTLFGVHAVGFVLNAATGNLRHSHVWLRFGDRAERWLLSPAQHQLHHSADPADFGRNYGTWLAVWDRLGGTLKLAPAAPPAAFGVADDERNHALDDVRSALVGPVVAAARALVRRPRRVAAGAATALLLAPTARAEEAEEAEAPMADPDAAADALPPDDDGAIVVVEATGPREAGSAHVVDEAELERFEHNDLHRVIARVPGVYVRGEDGFGLRPNIGIRGANSDRSAKITLMEDGVLMAPAPYAAPAGYFFPLTTRLAGVEVFKGPSAVRFGPNTVGGAVNLRTRPVPTEGAVGYLDAAAGTHGALKLHGYAGVGNERAGLLLEGAHVSSGGFKELDGDGPTGFDRQDLMLKARVAGPASAPVRHELVVKAGYAREDSHETYLGLAADDFEATPYRRYAASALDRMRWQRTQAELAWSVRGDAFDVRTVAYHHHLSRAWRKLNRFATGPALHTVLQRPDAGQAAVYADILRGVEDSADDGQHLMIGTNDRRFHAFGLQSAVRWRASAGLVHSQLEVGARLHGDVVDRLHTEDPYAMRSGHLVAAGGDTLTTLDARADAFALAAHVHEDLLIGPVRLLPGVRVEAIRSRMDVAAVEDDGDAVTRVVALPGMGVLVQAAWWLDVFAGAHRGFTPVAPGEPAEVRPETSWNYELGLRAGDPRTRAEVIGFFNDYVNLVGQCTFSGGCDATQLDRQFNGGKVFVYGLEAVLGQEIPLPHDLALSADLSYTWTGSRFRTGFVSGFPQFGTVAVGDALPYVPEHQGSARLALTHPRFDLALGLLARSAMRDVAGQGDIADLERVPPLWLLDLAATVHVTRHVSAYATATNLANRAFIESYRPFGARPTAPLQAMAGVKIRTR